MNTGLNRSIIIKENIECCNAQNKVGPDCGDQVPEDVASIIEDYLQQSRRSSAAETEAAEAEIQPNLDIGGDTELPVKMNVV